MSVYTGSSRVAPLFFLLAFSASLGIAQPALAPFVDATPACMQPAGVYDHLAAWGDYDADGRVDLFIAEYDGANRLCHNDGGGQWTTVTPPTLTGIGFITSAAWGDVDSDGRPDLLAVPYSSARMRLFHNDGGGLFSEQEIAAADGSRTAIWLDFDGDGRLDVYGTTGFSTPDQLLWNAGTGLFESRGAVLGLGIIQPWGGSDWGVCAFDHDQDGNQDLLLYTVAYTVLTSSSSLHLLHRREDGTYTDVTSTAFQGLPYTGYWDAAPGDYDNDGRVDLLVSESAGNTIRLLRQDGSGRFVDATPAELQGKAGWAASWVDLDNDGHLDLAILDEGIHLFLNAGAAGFIDVSAGQPFDTMVPEWPYAPVWADFDRDGRVDVAVPDMEGATRLYHNQAVPKHWLELDLRGVVSNPDAIGTRVRVTTGQDQQVRELSGARGSGSAPLAMQDAATVHFGLGDATAVDRAEVRWPSGIGQVLTGVPADQRLTLTEPVFETPGGTDVTVVAEDQIAGSSVTVTFSEVLQPGATWLAALPPDPGSRPPGYRFGNPALLYRLSSRAEYSGSVRVCLGIGGIDFDYPDETRLFGKLPDGSWQDVTTSFDRQTQVLCGESASLTTYAVVEPVGVVLEPRSLYANLFLWWAADRVAVADFNLDGRPDLAVGGYNNGAGWLQEEAGEFAHFWDWWGWNWDGASPGYGPGGVAVADLNVDGFPDLVTATNQYPWSVYWVYLGSGAPPWAGQPVSYLGLARNASDLALEDFNLDGKPDLLAVLQLTGDSELLIGTGTGGFVSTGVYPAGGTGLTVADFDRDGRLDSAVTNGASVKVTVPYPLSLPAEGVTQQIYALADAASDITHGDFDGDGTLDLAASLYYSNRIALLIGDGAGGFAAPAYFPSGGSGPSALEATDLNADQDLDLVVVNHLSRESAVLLGRGEGRLEFASAFALTPDWGLYWNRFEDNGISVDGDVAVADIDLDGRLDVIVADAEDVLILYNRTPNTHAGSDVVVSPVDPVTGSSPIDLTFEETTSPGFTSIGVSTEGPPLPEGFQLGSPPTYYDITTDIVFTGEVEICIRYAGVAYADEASLELLHGLPDGSWQSITTSLDTENDVICGTTSSFSPFIVVERMNRPPVADAGPGQAVEATSPAGALVTLDGSGSTDPDGDALSLTWTGPFGSVTGSMPTVAMPFGTSVVTLTVDDARGGTAQAEVSITVQDTTAPQVTITTPAEGAAYLLHAEILASYACSDSGAGVVSCAGPVASGSAIDTGRVGPLEFSVSAADLAGNSAFSVVAYLVRYGFLGFAPPVDAPPIVNRVTAGRTIPVKWQLTDASGAFVSNLAAVLSLQSTPVACEQAPTDTIPDSATTLEMESLSYDAQDNQFVYRWRTEKGWSGTCRQLWLNLADGSVQAARFKLE